MNIKLKNAKSCFNLYFFKPLKRKFTDACMDAIGRGACTNQNIAYIRIFLSRSIYNNINMNTVRKYAV